AEGGELAADIVVVLDRNGQAGEPPGPIWVRSRRREALRDVACRIQEADRQGIHPRLHLLDARGRGIEEFYRRNLAPAKQGDRIGRGKTTEFLVTGHAKASVPQTTTTTFALPVWKKEGQLPDAVTRSSHVSAARLSMVYR